MKFKKLRNTIGDDRKVIIKNRDTGKVDRITPMTDVDEKYDNMSVANIDLPKEKENADNSRPSFFFIEVESKNDEEKKKNKGHNKKKKKKHHKDDYDPIDEKLNGRK